MTNRPEPEFQVGDLIVCLGDDIDGSWSGAEGTIRKVEYNEGGDFAGARWVYSIEWDEEAGMRSEDALDTSDDFEIEAR